jgi:uncharacterized protein
MMKRAEPLPVGFEQFDFRVPVDDDELAVVAVLAAGPGPRRVAILVHGGPGGDKDGPGNLFVEMALHLAEAGIGSVRFAFRGCGESTGRYRDMTIARQVAELNAVRRFVDDELRPDRLALVAESFGATIGISVLDAGWQAVVLLWPCVWLLDGGFESYVSPDKLRVAEEGGFIVEGGQRIGAPFLAEIQAVGDVSALLSEHGVAPTLFIHGDADAEVPFGQSVRAARLVTGPVRLVAVPGGDHCLDAPHERDVVHAETAAWLREYLF